MQEVSGLAPAEGEGSTDQGTYEKSYGKEQEDMKVLIALGITGFVLIYFVLVPYLLWTAPSMDEDEEGDIMISPCEKCIEATFCRGTMPCRKKQKYDEWKKKAAEISRKGRKK